MRLLGAAFSIYAALVVVADEGGGGGQLKQKRRLGGIGKFIDPKSISSRPDSPQQPKLCDKNDIPRLVEIMASHSEKASLRPFFTEDQMLFPGLDSSLLSEAFLGKKIFMYGDSTLRQFNLLLHVLLTPDYLSDVPEGRDALLHSLSAMDLSEANDRVPVLEYLEQHQWTSTFKVSTYPGCRGCGVTKLRDGTNIEFLAKDPSKSQCGVELQRPIDSECNIYTPSILKSIVEK